MAGIYLHIPFCKKACHYCDFHFTTSMKYKDELLEAMHQEIELQKNYLHGHKIDTIYFGGGTPSVIGALEIQKLIDHLGKTFPVDPQAEITLEANPDDLDASLVKALRQTPVNRFSIGVQSFFEEDLLWMNRAHNAAQAEAAIKRVQDAGFENITADLIYGYPLLKDEKWKHNIQSMINFGVPHISSYSLTVEPRTALAHFIKKGKQAQPSDSQSAEQFVILMNALQDADYEHYEISNFALPGWHSKHNANYWKGIHYLGLGPSAHSFNGESRSWNVANNPKYIEAIFAHRLASETEILSKTDRFNEYLMTGLRTKWGIDLKKIAFDFGNDYRSYLLQEIPKFEDKGWLKTESETITLTQDGKLFADHVAAELFITEE